MKSVRLMAMMSVAGLVLGSGCTVGSDYQRPSAAAPSVYKEQAGWKLAQPNELAARGDWWAVYNDPLLNQLESEIDISNQTIKQYEAAYREALAVVGGGQAGYYPTVSLSNADSRSGRLNGGRVTTASGLSQGQNSFALSGSVSWSVDVWGKIRRTVESEVASAQSSAAELAGARLSAQATLATDYLQLRVADENKRLYDTTVKAYQRSLEITQNQYHAGIATRADVASAEAQLENARAAGINVDVVRAQLEHAIAILVGKPPAEFSIATVDRKLEVPSIPIAVPSVLLERRPDVADAERKAAAANAQIGVALAAFYPDITLSGSLDFSSGMIGTLLHAANGVWSYGPGVSETLFDGGQRSAVVAEARATYDQDVATYRQTVLTAFQGVEDNLSALRVLEQEAAVQERAVSAAKVSVNLNLDQYRAGIVAYTAVVTAQATQLTSEQSALTIRQSRLTDSVALIQNLGGGWNAAQLPDSS